LHINNRLSKATTYSEWASTYSVDDNEEYYMGSDTIPRGISDHVIESPPGEAAEITCDPKGSYDIFTRVHAHFLVVVGKSGYKSLELECKLGAEPRSSGRFMPNAAGIYRDPVVGARKFFSTDPTFSKGLKEGDVVEKAGYLESPDPPVRVVRKGKVIATVHFDYNATYCEGQI